MSDEKPSKLDDSRAGFELEPEVTPPPLPGQVIVRDDDEELHGALGADLLMHALNCVRTFGDFHLALSGGSTPLPFYRRLMVDPAYRGFPWNRTHLWIVDERRVPMTDERSNFLHIAELLVEHSDIPKDRVHPIAAMEDNADTQYERELVEALSWREKGHDRLDFILLGMGSDCHTASLFPRSPALHARDRLVAINSGPTVTPPDRVTMTYRLINASRFIAVLATGSSKRDALKRASDERVAWEDAPIKAVRPLGGALRWYLDAAACAN